MNVSISKSKTSSAKTPAVEKVQTEPHKVHRIDNVIKVIVNPDDYTVLYRDGKEIKIQRLYEWMEWVKNNRSKSTFPRDYNTSIVFETHIFEDAPPGKMYVSVEHWNDYFFQAVIHIDDARTAFMK